MTLKAGFKKLKTGTCILYIVNELSTVIIIVCVDGVLAIEDKLALVDTI